MSEDYINYNYKMPIAKSKQTAVEFLFELLPTIVQRDLKHKFEQAKQMEKGQIEDAHIEGQRVFDKYPHTEWTNFQAELYYEQTYGGNK